jgi:hypothetical protein
LPRFQRTIFSLVAALLASVAPALPAAAVRVTTWNLEWFPNGSPKDAKPLITASKASDHYPVTCDFSLGGAYAQTTPVPANRSQVQLGNEDGKSATVPQFVTLIQPVRIKIPYGETVLPRGLKLPIISRDPQTVTVKYLDGTQAIPIASTDLR